MGHVETQRSEDRKRWLAALLVRLKACNPGETYPLDVMERDLILEALSSRDGNEQELNKTEG